MELHERIQTARPLTGSDGRDPFSDLKNRLHLALINELGPQLFTIGTDPGQFRGRVENDLKERLQQEQGLSREDRERLLAEIADDVVGYGPLERVLADESVSEIMVNGAHEIWVERQGRLYETTLHFTDDSHLRRIINKMVAQVGRRIDESSPMVDARLPDGSRVNAVIAPLSLSGPLLTIRKFQQKRFDLDELVRIGTLSRETVDFLRLAVEAELNILISGGTGAGKTTLLNALSAAVPNSDRIVTIEDAAELQLVQEHVLRLESRPKNIEGEGEITIRDLVRNSLRMRPDRIIVGEVRGAEALDMLQAMNTGHEGSLSTVHANTPRDALARIETMVMMRSPSLMKLDSTFSSVVLPAPVPPDTMTFRRQAMVACRKSSIGCVSALSVTRSSAFSRSAGKRRIDSSGPSTASGGMMAFTREPSGNRASTIGLDSSMRRPTLLTMRSMICSRCASSLKVTAVGSSRPWRSTYTWSKRLTRMSETSGSRSSISSGPRPNSSLSTSVTSVSRSSRLIGVVSLTPSMMTPMIRRISGSASSRLTRVRRSRFRRFSRS